MKTAVIRARMSKKYEMTMPNTAYVIVLNWNGYADTIECVKSCLGLDYPSFHIVVVDNCSDDNSESILKMEFPQLAVLQTGKNLGYAGGNNVGIRYALDKKADYIWLLNNDTVVDPKALTELVKAAESEPAAGMAGSKILFYSEPTLIHYAGGMVDADLGISEHIGIYQKDNHQFDALSETGYITGCSLLVKRSLIEAIGFMDEAYFLYFEESEWCLRAKKHGFRLLYVPGSLVYHKESASTRKVGGAATYYMTRNRLYFISRNGTDAKWLTRFQVDLVTLLKHTFHRDFVQVRSMLAAYRHWITGYAGCRACLSKVKKV